MDEATTTLQEGISGAAKHLDEVNDSRPAITAAIARLLGMTNVPQTRRMACAIIANAMVFHERIAGIHEKIRPLSMVCGDAVPNPQRRGAGGLDRHPGRQLLGDIRHRQGHTGTAAVGATRPIS